MGQGSIFITKMGYKVHGKMVNKRCIMVRIEVLKHDASIPHPTGFEYTL